jgi:VanZ family protein
MIERWTSPTQRRWAFWLCLLVVIALALMRPSPDMPTTGWDKANHALAFAVLALLGALAYPGRMVRVLIGLLAYGVLIEVLQSFTSYRDSDVRDVFADCVGLAIGWQVFGLLRRTRKSAVRSDPSGRQPAPRAPTD